MPIYEFYSPNTRKIYSFFARSLAYSGKIPRCPDDASAPMEKLISQFSLIGRAKEKAELPDGPDFDDPRMDAAMASMEREFGRMDEKNPDPRQLARMMKQMAALTGEQLPGPMLQMMERLEKGEDPEKLEEEYGPELEQFEPGPGDETGDDSPGATALRRLRRRPIQRDPTLYEIAEYVD